MIESQHAPFMVEVTQDHLQSIPSWAHMVQIRHEDIVERNVRRPSGGGVRGLDELCSDTLSPRHDQHYHLAFVGPAGDSEVVRICPIGNPFLTAKESGLIARQGLKISITLLR